MVTLGSVAGFAPVVGRPAYVAAKHAVVGLMEALRPELAADGVAVTVVHPTFVTSPLVTAPSTTATTSSTTAAEGATISATPGPPARTTTRTTTGCGRRWSRRRRGRSTWPAPAR